MNPSSLCQDGQGWPSLVVAGEGVLLDHVLTPGTKRSCQAGFGKPRAVMVTDSSRSCPAEPHPRLAPPELSEGWHGAGPAAMWGQLQLGWPRAPALLLPSLLKGRGSLGKQTTPTKAPGPTGLSLQGERSPVAATPTLM